MLTLSYPRGQDFNRWAESWKRHNLLGAQSIRPHFITFMPLAYILYDQTHNLCADMSTWVSLAFCLAYQLFDMTFRAVFTAHWRDLGLTGLINYKWKEEGRQHSWRLDGFASFEIFGTAARLRTAFPAPTTGMSKRRLGFGASRAEVSKSHSSGPSASTFYGKLFTASWFIPGAMTGDFHSESYFRQFIVGIKFKLLTRIMMAFQYLCQIGPSILNRHCSRMRNVPQWILIHILHSTQFTLASHSLKNLLLSEW